MAEGLLQHIHIQRVRRTSLGTKGWITWILLTFELSGRVERKFDKESHKTTGGYIRRSLVCFYREHLRRPLYRQDAHKPRIVHSTAPVTTGGRLKRLCDGSQAQADELFEAFYRSSYGYTGSLTATPRCPLVSKSYSSTHGRRQLRIRLCACIASHTGHEKHSLLSI